MRDQQYFELRSRAVKRMKETDNPNPFPHKFNVTYDLRNFERDFSYLKKGEVLRERVIQVGCRIYNIRRAGDNLRFYEVAVDGAEIQIMAQSQEAAGMFCSCGERFGFRMLSNEQAMSSSLTSMTIYGVETSLVSLDSPAARVRGRMRTTLANFPSLLSKSFYSLHVYIKFHPNITVSRTKRRDTATATSTFL